MSRFADGARRVHVPFNPGPPSGPRGVPILKPPPGGSLLFRCLSAKILDTHVHWECPENPRAGDRPCLGPDLCDYCDRNASVRWIGWVGALVLPIRRARVVPITAHCWRESPCLRERNGQLRGLGIKLYRKLPTAGGPIFAEIVDLPGDIPFPAEPSLESSLGILWKLSAADIAAWKLARSPMPVEPPPEPDHRVDPDLF